jgi:hypothetical protein
MEVVVLLILSQDNPRTIPGQDYLRARDEISCSFSFVFLTDSVVAILVT